MKNHFLKGLIAVALLLVPGFVLAEDSPMRYWEYTSSARLNGRWFYGSGSNGYSGSYREQEGYALVLGQKVHYWLYDTISYHNGDSSEIYNEVIPYWVEKMGFAIDFDNIEIYNPNTNLANSVKALMKQRGCDVGVTINLEVSPCYVMINEYLTNTNTYKTTVYYLYK